MHKLRCKYIYFDSRHTANFRSVLYLLGITQDKIKNMESQ